MRFDSNDFNLYIKGIFFSGIFKFMIYENKNLFELLAFGIAGFFIQLLIIILFPISLIIALLLSIKLEK